MARFQFGGVAEAWVVTTELLDVDTNAVVLTTTPVTLQIYDAPYGLGQLVDNFLDADGNTVSEIVVPTGNPYIPRFSGPDGFQSLWVETIPGTWMPVPRFADGTETGDGGSGSAGGQVISASEPTNATTTPAPVTELGLTVPGAGTYYFRYDLFVESSSGAVETQWSLTGPAVSSARVAYRRFAASAGPNASVTTALGTVAGSGTGGIVDNAAYRQVIEGAIVADGAGTLTPQFNPATGGTTVTIRSQSSGQLTPEGAAGAGGGIGDVLIDGGNEYEYPDSQSPPWLVLRRPNDNTASTGWDNMVELYYYDQSTSVYRLGWYINEKALLRVRGVTPSDVPARIMAHPNHNANTPIVEVTKDDNTAKLVQFLLSQVLFHVPIVIPYLTNPLGERLYFGSADPATDPAYADHRPDVGAAWIDYNNPPA